MGLGSYACGVGPCGHDPVASPSTRSTAASAIPYYDPLIRGFATTSDGDLVSVHPVVQEASFALGVALGSIPSAPTVGLNIRRIKSARSADVPIVARDEVEVALKRLIDAGDIQIVRVTASAAWGRVLMETEFVNLRDPVRPQSITVQSRF